MVNWDSRFNYSRELLFSLGYVCIDFFYSISVFFIAYKMRVENYPEIRQPLVFRPIVLGPIGLH